MKDFGWAGSWTTGLSARWWCWALRHRSKPGARFVVPHRERFDLGRGKLLPPARASQKRGKAAVARFEASGSSRLYLCSENSLVLSCCIFEKLNF